MVSLDIEHVTLHGNLEVLSHILERYVPYAVMLGGAVK